MKVFTLLLLTTVFIISCGQSRQEKALHLYEQGKLLEEMQLPDSAMTLYQQAVSELQKVNNDTLSGVIYNRVGDLMFGNDLYPESFEPYSKAFPYNSRLHDQTEASRSLRGMGKTFLFRFIPDSAIVYFNRALSISPRISTQEEISLIHNNLSLAYFHAGKYDLSLIHNAKALQLCQDSSNIFKNYSVRGNLFIQTRQYDSAAIYYLLGYNSKNIRTQAACIDGLANLAKATDNPDSAKYISIFQLLKDSIERNSKPFDILKKDKLYNVQKTKKEITNSYGYILAGVLLLCLIFIIIAIKRHRSEKEKNKELSNISKKMQVEMAKLQCKLDLAVEKNEIRQSQLLTNQLQKVQETAINEIKELGSKLATEFRKSDTYKEMREKLDGGQMREKERIAYQKKILETFRPFNTYLITFLGFSAEDCFYCCLSLLKFNTHECALCRNITDDSIRSQKRRLKNKIKEIFGTETASDHIFMKTK